MLTKLVFAFASLLAVLSVGPAFAETATVTAIPNNFPHLKYEPANPGMNAVIDVTSGMVTVMVLHASTIVADGVQYDIGNDQKLVVEVKQHASVVTGTLILVNFDGAVGTYSTYRGQRTVKFEGNGGAIDQHDYDEVALSGAGQFTAANWTSVITRRDAVVKTVDVRDVAVFGNSDVTVTNCWVASGFSTVAMKTTGCRYPQGNFVALPAKE